MQTVGAGPLDCISRHSFHAVSTWRPKNRIKQGKSGQNRAGSIPVIRFFLCQKKKPHKWAGNGLPMRFLLRSVCGLIPQICGMTPQICGFSFPRSFHEITCFALCGYFSRYSARFSFRLSVLRPQFPGHNADQASCQFSSRERLSRSTWPL